MSIFTGNNPFLKLVNNRAELFFQARLKALIMRSRTSLSNWKSMLPSGVTPKRNPTACLASAILEFGCHQKNHFSFFVVYLGYCESSGDPQIGITPGFTWRPSLRGSAQVSSNWHHSANQGSTTCCVAPLSAIKILFKTGFLRYLITTFCHLKTFLLDFKFYIGY